MFNNAKIQQYFIFQILTSLTTAKNTCKSTPSTLQKLSLKQANSYKQPLYITTNFTAFCNTNCNTNCTSNLTILFSLPCSTQAFTILKIRRQIEAPYSSHRQQTKRAIKPHYYWLYDSFYYYY